MALTPEQNERLTYMLEALEPETKAMSDVARGFVEDQIKRHDQYAERMFLSPKQESWLERLYIEHVGPLRDIPNSMRGAREDLLGEEPPNRRTEPVYKPYKPSPRTPDDDIPF